MRKLVDTTSVVNHHRTHGYMNTQYHVDIKYTDGSLDLIWMPADYYIDVFETPMTNGQTVTFDLDYFNANKQYLFS